MRLRRLAGMGWGELAGRGRQKAAQWVDRVAPVLAPSQRGVAGLTGTGRSGGDKSAGLELFRHAAPRRFFVGTETGDAAEILKEQAPGAVREIIAAANGLFSRRFDLLGYKQLHFGQPIDWHLDPVSGRRAPIKHWSRIDVLDADAVGDSKVIWELNRHQWLVRLAQAYWITGDRRFADEALDLVDDWCRANPYGVGINWASSLEVALRLISWSWAFILMRDAPTLEEREFGGLLAQVRRHAGHVERYLSTYFSPNTHLTGEALGLLYASALFPELVEAPRWRRIARDVLVDECLRQVHEDGVYFEQATGYQRYTIDIYLHFLILAARNGLSVPAAVRNRIERAVEFLASVTEPHGIMPSIGDSDGGWLLPLTQRAPTDCRGTFAVAAAVFGRADFLAAAGGPAPEVLWLLGETGWEHLRSLSKQRPRARASDVFPDGGYVVMRADMAGETNQLLFDAGPLGCPVSGAHGHADLLSVQVSAFGEPYLVDPGTFCYTADNGWRDYFRSTAAHSAVTIDGVSQAQPSGPFSWRARPKARLLEWHSAEGLDVASASHDAYARLGDPVRHRRRVIFVKPRYWVIVDELEGGTEHQVDVRFQCAPKAVAKGPQGWVSVRGKLGEGLWFAAMSSVPVAVAVAEGSLNPIEGWISPEYGQRRPAPVVIFRTTARLPLRVATLVVPSRHLAAGPPAVTAEFGADGQISGLRLPDSNEYIRFDEKFVRVAAIESGDIAPVGTGSER